MKKSILLSLFVSLLCGLAVAQDSNSPWRPFGSDYGDLTMYGNSSTKVTTLVVSNISSTTVLVNTNRLVVTGDIVSGGAVTGATLRVTSTSLLSGAVTASGNLTVGGAITGVTEVCTGDIKGATLSIGSGSLKRIAGTLAWVEGNITNVLDADVTSP